MELAPLKRKQDQWEKELTAKHGGASLEIIGYRRHAGELQANVKFVNDNPQWIAVPPNVDVNLAQLLKYMTTDEQVKGSKVWAESVPRKRLQEAMEEAIGDR